MLVECPPPEAGHGEWRWEVIDPEIGKAPAKLYYFRYHNNSVAIQFCCDIFSLTA
jgi:hypothetical protein